MTKKKPKSEYKKMGRPSSVTPEVLAELKMCFSKGLTDLQAASYVGISVDALYHYCNKNPDFSKLKEVLKQQLVVRSKFNLAESIEIDKNLQDSKWYLERKAKDEFSTRNETTGKDGQALEVKTVYIEKEEIAEMLEHIKETI